MSPDQGMALGLILSSVGWLIVQCAAWAREDDNVKGVDRQ